MSMQLLKNNKGAINYVDQMRLNMAFNLYIAMTAPFRNTRASLPNAYL
jgi:hypothetical protein